MEKETKKVTKKVTKKPTKTVAAKKTTKKATTKKVVAPKPKEEVKKTSTVEPKKTDQLEMRQILLILFMVVVVAGVCFGFIYAWIKMNERGDATEQERLAQLSVQVAGTDSSKIVMKDIYPMNEAGGLSTDPYIFVLTNTGEYSVNYSLNLVEDEEAKAACSEENQGVACKTISVDSIHYSIKKDGGEFTSGLLKDDHGVIDMGIVPAKTGDENPQVRYELKLWVDYDTEEDWDGAQFLGKIEVRTQAGE